MKTIAAIVLAVIVNGVALVASAYFLSGFDIAGDITTIVVLAVVLTLLNAVVKPILKLILGPVIVITLGLGLIVVNALILFILDFLSPNLTIQTIPALLYASLIFGAINLIFHGATHE